MNYRHLECEEFCLSLFFNLSGKSSEIFLLFASHNSYLMLAIQHDVNNVAFVALHFLYLVSCRPRLRISFLYILFTLSREAFSVVFNAFLPLRKAIQFIFTGKSFCFYSAILRTTQKHSSRSFRFIALFRPMF